MKKIFTFATVAVLVLSLMFSCKPKEEVKDPAEQVGTPEWFEKWTEGDKEDKVTINEENLYGYWKMAILALIEDGADVPSGGYEYTDLVEEAYYLEIAKDKHYVTYDYSDGTLVTDNGEWKLSGKHLIFNHKTYNSPWGVLDGEYTVEWLEADRLVISTPKMYEEGTTEYRVYTRISKLPTLPKTNAEYLVGNGWKITADSVVTFEGKGYYNESHVFIVTEKKVIDKQVNVLKDAVMRFYEDGAFRLKDANDKVLGTCEWDEIQDGKTYLMLSLYYIDEIGWHEAEIPGLCSALTFTLNTADKTKAVFDAEQTLPMESDKIKQWRKYYYHTEAIK